MKVKVENISESLQEEDLKKEFGSIAQCKVDFHVNSSKGHWAFVEYPDILQVNEAIKKYHGKDLGGKKLKVALSDQVISLATQAKRERSRSPLRQVITFSKPKAAPDVIQLPGSKVSLPMKQTVEPSQEVKAPNEVTQEEPKQEEPKQETKQEEPKQEETKQEEPTEVTIEAEDGSKFAVTEDPNKVQCLVCEKTVTRKGIKTHINSKAHKNSSK